MEINVEGKKELAIEAYKVLDGIDACCIRFLRHHFVQHWTQYDGLLAQVIGIYSERSQISTARKKFTCSIGCYLAAIISIFSKLAVDMLNRMND